MTSIKNSQIEQFKKDEKLQSKCEQNLYNSITSFVDQKLIKSSKEIYDVPVHRLNIKDECIPIISNFVKNNPQIKGVKISSKSCYDVPTYYGFTTRLYLDGKDNVVTFDFTSQNQLKDTNVTKN